MTHSHQASKARRQILGLMEHLGLLVQSVQGKSPLLKGSLYERRYKCGKPGCRCADGKLHGRTVLSIYKNGRSRLVSFKDADLDQLTEQVSNWQRFRKTRAEIVTTCALLLKAVDRLGKLREADVKQLQLEGRKQDA